MTPEAKPPIISEADVDYSRLKVIALIAVVTALAGCFGYFFSCGSFISGLLAACFLLIGFILQALLIKSAPRIALALFAEAALMSLVVKIFRPNWPWFALAVALVLFYIFVFLAHRAGRQEREESLRIRFFKIAYAVLPGSVTGLAVFAAVALGFSLKVDELTSQNYFNYLFKPVAPVFKIYVPNFSFEMTTDKFLTSFAERALKNQGTGEVGGFGKLAEPAKQQFLEKAGQELKKSLENYTGSPINSKETVGENFYGIFREKAAKFLGQYPPVYVSLAIALVIILLIKSTALLFYWLLAFFAFIFYEILLATNFVTLSLETKSREIVLLK